MPWIIFFILLYLCTALQVADFGTLVRHDLLIVRPEFLSLLAVFYCLYGPDDAAPLAAFWCGLAYDLTDDPTRGLFGIHAVGMGLVGYALVKIRLSIFREQPLSQMVMAILSVIAFGVVTGLFRSIITLVLKGFSVGLQDWRLREMPTLAHLTGSALYTGLLAVPLFWLLMRFRHLLGVDLHRARSRA